MEKSSDVIVVGGGPSGSFCALNITKRGFNVTLFEEHGEIGVPCHCPGHLSINGLKNLGLYPLPKGIVENIFVGARIYSPKGLDVAIRFASPVTCAVNRSLFDKYIAQLAEKAGARVLLNSKVESLMLEGEHIKGVVAKTDGGALKFLGKMVVDAEGTAYKILRQAKLSPPSRDSFVYCVNAKVENVENVEPDIVEVFLGNAYAPGFYAWLIPIRDDAAKIGLGTKRGNPKALLKKLMHKHPTASKKLGRAKILQEIFHLIPIGGPVKAYADGFLAVGDAASQVKPTTGGGVVLGLNCAKIAADVAVKALELEDYSPEFLSMYQRRFMKYLGFDIKIMIKARKLLNEISDEGLDRFIDFCNKISIEKDSRDIKEIDFQGRFLLGAWQKPRILAALTYFLLNNFLSR